MPRSIKDVSVVIIGGINTDVTFSGISHFAEPGGYVPAKKVTIGPGGKARNLAEMIARLQPGGEVVMVSKTIKDQFGLWKPPIKALKDAGVNIDYIKVLDQTEAAEYPGMALILVTEEGQNQIYPTNINELFTQKDIDGVEPVFKAAKSNNGLLAVSLEFPLDKAAYVMEKAARHGLRIALDPGGMTEETDASKLFEQELFLFKPNEQETKLLTGVTVRDLVSARQAADKLLRHSIRHLVITAGTKGAYVFSKGVAKNVPVIDFPDMAERDATGCGDQTMAALCASLIQQDDIVKATELAMKASSLQFYRLGIQPVTAAELQDA